MQKITQYNIVYQTNNVVKSSRRNTMKRLFRSFLAFITLSPNKNTIWPDRSLDQIGADYHVRRIASPKWQRKLRFITNFAIKSGFVRKKIFQNLTLKEITIAYRIGHPEWKNS